MHMITWSGSDVWFGGGWTNGSLVTVRLPARNIANSEWERVYDWA